MNVIPAHKSNYTAGRGGKTVDTLVIHYTANNGDTAEGNCRYFQGENREASAHYFVDEREVCRSVPEADTAWHAGKYSVNQRSIGVEICSRLDSKGKYYLPDGAVENAVRLCRELMEKYRIPTANVIRHYDVTGKNCPAPMVQNSVLWQNFKKRLGETDRERVIRATGISAKTAAYLDGYKYAADLWKKLAAAISKA